MNPVALTRYLKNRFTRLFLFDESDQELFLSIVSTQLRHGRTYAAIFKDLQFDTNRYHKELARRSLDPDTQFFADNYADLVGSRRARLLVLAQRYNSVEAFIDHVLHPKTDLSLLKPFVLKLLSEWLFFLVLVAVTAAVYIYGDLISALYIDISGTDLYLAGGILVEYWLFFLIAALIAAYVYLENRSNPTPLRTAMKRLGLYGFYDNKYAIELFTTFHILTESAKKGGSAINIPALFNRLFEVYGDTPLRQQQFRTITHSLARGSTLRDALRKTNLLPPAEMSLYFGLTPFNTIEQHNAAARTVVDQLTKKTELRIKRAALNISIWLYSAIAIGAIGVLEMTMSSALQLLESI